MMLQRVAYVLGFLGALAIGALSALAIPHSLADLRWIEAHRRALGLWMLAAFIWTLIWLGAAYGIYIDQWRFSALSRTNRQLEDTIRRAIRRCGLAVTQRPESGECPCPVLSVLPSAGEESD